MIVHQIDIKCVAVHEEKDNPPVAGNGHTPVAFQFAPQRVEPVPRQIQGARVTGLIEVSQHILDAPDLIGPEPLGSSPSNRRFSPLWRNVLSIYDTVHRIGTDVKQESILRSRRVARLPSGNREDSQIVSHPWQMLILTATTTSRKSARLLGKQVIL